MLTLTLCLSLVSGAEPSARLLPEEDTVADFERLSRELRILDAHIAMLKPEMPTGFVVGAVLGFSSGVLLLPGIPIFIIGIGSGAAVFVAGIVLITLGLGGVVTGLVCLVSGSAAEDALANERARSVEQREVLRRRVEQVRPPPQPPEQLPWMPGVQRELTVPRMVTVARF
jgi:hypothetical protein